MLKQEITGLYGTRYRARGCFNFTSALSMTLKEHEELNKSVNTQLHSWNKSR